MTLIPFHGMLIPDTEAGRTLTAKAWEQTPLGPAEDWPATLKAQIQSCLQTTFPMALGWGPRQPFIYNDAHIALIGNRHPAAMGQPVLEVYQEVADFLAPVLQRVVHGGETIALEEALFALWRKDDLLAPEEGYFDVSYSPLHDEQGAIQGIVCLANETTQSVLQSRRRATTKAVADLVIHHPADARNLPDLRQALLPNERDFANVIFYQTHEGGRTLVPIWGHPRGYHRRMRDSSALQQSLQHLRALGDEGHGVFRVGPRQFAAVVTSRSLLGNRGHLMLVEPAPEVRADDDYVAFLRMQNEVMVGGLFRLLSDQAARATAEQQLSARDRLYRLLFEHSSVAIVLLEPEGPIRAANPASCRLLGYSEQELLSLSYRTIADSESRRIDLALTELAFDGRAETTLRVLRKDGTTLLADVSAVQFRDPSTSSDRIVAMLRDAAPRLLSQEQLKTSARLQALGELTGGISHDFNNLLNVIINGTEELQEQLPEGSTPATTAELMLQAGLRAADLTRQLLAFSQKRPMQPRALSVAECLNETAELMRGTLGNGIRLSCQADSNLQVETDPGQLQNALMNLCLNARDAMPDGGRLQLLAEPQDVDAACASDLGIKPGRYAALRVTDSGRGIAPDLLSQVVEPFVTTKPEGQGAGLGLSMAYGYARQSRGTMQIQSTSGAGTQVSLLLPVRQTSARAEANDGPGNAQAHDSTRPHLLLVEDNDMLGPMLQRTLQQAGYRVSLRTEGSAALVALLADPSIGVLITDIVLGTDMDGWQLIDAAREHRRQLLVITMSGYAAGKTRDTRTSVDFPGLSKPFRPRELVTMLQRLLHEPD